MSIHKLREEALSGYTEEDISEGKRYLGYYLNSYKQGECKHKNVFTDCSISSDKIRNFIVKALNYHCIKFTCTYSKQLWWGLEVTFK